MSPAKAVAELKTVVYTCGKQDILEDRKGDLWFGTSNEVYRYDARLPDGKEIPYKL
ncbi:two-component regulator propeller domain-containing protein [Pedobacter sp. R-06]|uniref:two-component regulator propeller domain-containing protein n=1 Tax=Pedobacter sp. R-06 TaxID=3404051 RepID=UPI003CE9044B